MFNTTKQLIEEIGHSFMVEIHLDDLAEIGIHKFHHEIDVGKLFESLLGRKCVQQTNYLSKHNIKHLSHHFTPTPFHFHNVSGKFFDFFPEKSTLQQWEKSIFISKAFRLRKPVMVGPEMPKGKNMRRKKKESLHLLGKGKPAVHNSHFCD